MRIDDYDDESAIEPLQPWELPKCPACSDHPGWANGDLSRRREPLDVCRRCGSGVALEGAL